MPALLKINPVVEPKPWNAVVLWCASIIRVRPALNEMKPVETISRTAAKVLPAGIVRVRPALL